MEIRQEITQILNTLPTEVLGEVLQFLRHIEQGVQEKLRLSENLKTVLQEDRELLTKLAQ